MNLNFVSQAATSVSSHLTTETNRPSRSVEIRITTRSGGEMFVTVNRSVIEVESKDRFVEELANLSKRMAARHSKAFDGPWHWPQD
jgi:hypothetical protein